MVEEWKSATYLVELLAIPFKVMRATDSSSKGMIRTIYDLMLQLTEDVNAKLEAGEKILPRAANQEEGIFRNDVECTRIFKAFIARHYDGKTFTNKDSEEKRASLVSQEGLTAFLTLEGSFGLPEAIPDREAVKAGKHSMVQWWGWDGTDHPHLASLACRALTQPVFDDGSTFHPSGLVMSEDDLLGHFASPLPLLCTSTRNPKPRCNPTYPLFSSSQVFDDGSTFHPSVFDDGSNFHPSVLDMPEDDLLGHLASTFNPTLNPNVSLRIPLNHLQVFDDGSTFHPSVLDMSKDDLLGHFASGVANVAAISLSADYPTLAAVPHVFANSYKNVIAVALALDDYTFPLADKVKEILAVSPSHLLSLRVSVALHISRDPSKFMVAAVAAAPAAAAESAKEEAKPAEEEESDDDMGFSLFDKMHCSARLSQASASLTRCAAEQGES
ncbi:unnamed protein product [Closterium sp. NIES-65]|nr:unnamed protein product [Closterium sp. NIES-65]